MASLTWTLSAPANPVKRTLLLTVTFALLGQTGDALAEKQTMGFVVTQWNTAMYETLFMDECPEGPAPGNAEIWESTVTPEEPPLLPASVDHSDAAYELPRTQRRRHLCRAHVSRPTRPSGLWRGNMPTASTWTEIRTGEATPNTCAHHDILRRAGLVHDRH